MTEIEHEGQVLDIEKIEKNAVHLVSGEVIEVNNYTQAELEAKLASASQPKRKLFKSK